MLNNIYLSEFINFSQRYTLDELKYSTYESTNGFSIYRVTNESNGDKSKYESTNEKSNDDKSMYRLFLKMGIRDSVRCDFTFYYASESTLKQDVTALKKLKSFNLEL